MNIWLDEDSGLDEGAKAILSRAADLCLKAEDIGEPDRFALSLTLVDEEEIRQINRDFRGIDRVTDVLSFPQFETADEAREAAEKAALSGVEIPAERLPGTLAMELFLAGYADVLRTHDVAALRQALAVRRKLYPAD